jgi:predicted TIM-barrel fold metal-dependent hydrolase
MLDLSAIPIVDHHAHNLLRPDVSFPYISAFTEAYDPEVVAHQAAETLCFRRSVREIGELLGCAPEVGAIEAARARIGYEEVARRCFAAGGFAALLLDDGLLPDKIMPTAWHARFAPVRRLLRVEYLAERLIAEAVSWEHFAEGFRYALRDLAADVAGYKSIVAYRTGLALDPPDDGAAAASFAELRQQARPGERPRLAAKPLNDWVVWTTLREAARSGTPVQLHTGFGDPDLDLRLANPLHLRPVLEDASIRGAPIVLLHAGYPFTREAGYLAAVYPNVYLDLGLAIPLLSVVGMAAVVRAGFELTPLTKLLVSTDAHLVPELFYLGARWGRRALGTELERAVSDGDLIAAEAERAGAMILRDNAAKLYGLAD